MSSSSSRFLEISPQVRVLPVIHGSGDCAILARDELLARPYDCLAVPLPPSFQDDVESAVRLLPTISGVVQVPGNEDEETSTSSYVPIDPCQPVIAAIRTALGERIERAFIDLETARFEPQFAVLPDPYALKAVRPEAFAAALLPDLPPPATAQHRDRLTWMAHQLRRLEQRHQSILLVCSLLDWPWIRDAYQRRLAPCEEAPLAPDLQTFSVQPDTLLFFLGELPFVTALYERGRRELTADDNLSVDGVKELLQAARDRLGREQPVLAQQITPQTLGVCLQYLRNLSLMHRRLTPDLYHLVLAAQQTAGDAYALAVAETAREYPYQGQHDHGIEPPDRLLRMGVDRADLPGFGLCPMVSRLSGHPLSWRSLPLRPRPPARDRELWKQRWNPYGMCSWPPEDDRIESFHRHVRDQARAALGADLARTEKFSTSVKDGIDIRDTLRHWHTGEIYVKVIPPDRGSIESVLFLFDAPADPRVYTHRATWYAEHDEESTLAFYATEPMADLVGPGIARARYGGALFLFPPRPIPDVWEDPRFDRLADTLEERLLAAALWHSRQRHVALVSPAAPPASWRRLARRLGRKLIHLPLRRFSGQTVERVRTFHVLNGRHIRSYAAEFIRDL